MWGTDDPSGLTICTLKITNPNDTKWEIHWRSPPSICDVQYIPKVILWQTLVMSSIFGVYTFTQAADTTSVCINVCTKSQNNSAEGFPDEKNLWWKDNNGSVCHSYLQNIAKKKPLETMLYSIYCWWQEGKWLHCFKVYWGSIEKLVSLPLPFSSLYENFTKMSQKWNCCNLKPRVEMNVIACLYFLHFAVTVGSNYSFNLAAVNWF